MLREPQNPAQLTARIACPVHLRRASARNIRGSPEPVASPFNPAHQQTRPCRHTAAATNRSTPRRYHAHGSAPVLLSCFQLSLRTIIICDLVKTSVYRSNSDQFRTHVKIPLVHPTDHGKDHQGFDRKYFFLYLAYTKSSMLNTAHAQAGPSVCYSALNRETFGAET